MAAAVEQQQPPPQQPPAPAQQPPQQPLRNSATPPLLAAEREKEHERETNEPSTPPEPVNADKEKGGERYFEREREKERDMERDKEPEREEFDREHGRDQEREQRDRLQPIVAQPTDDPATRRYGEEDAFRFSQLPPKSQPASQPNDKQYQYRHYPNRDKDDNKLVFVENSVYPSSSRVRSPPSSTSSHREYAPPQYQPPLHHPNHPNNNIPPPPRRSSPQPYNSTPTSAFTRYAPVNTQLPNNHHNHHPQPSAPFPYTGASQSSIPPPSHNSRTATTFIPVQPIPSPSATPSSTSSSPTTANFPHASARATERFPKALVASAAAPQSDSIKVPPAPRPSLPPLDVNAETIVDGYVQFMMHYDQKLDPGDNKTIVDQQKRMTSVPKTGNVEYTVWQLFESVRELNRGDIKNWSQLVGHLGVGESTRPQFAQRVKRWLQKNRIDTYFDYLLGNSYDFEGSGESMDGCLNRGNARKRWRGENNGRSLYQRGGMGFGEMTRKRRGTKVKSGLKVEDEMEVDGEEGESEEVDGSSQGEEVASENGMEDIDEDEEEDEEMETDKPRRGGPGSRRRKQGQGEVVGRRRKRARTRRSESVEEEEEVDDEDGSIDDEDEQDSERRAKVNVKRPPVEDDEEDELDSEPEGETPLIRRPSANDSNGDDQAHPNGIRLPPVAGLSPKQESTMPNGELFSNSAASKQHPNGELFSNSSVSKQHRFVIEKPWVPQRQYQLPAHVVAAAQSPTMSVYMPGNASEPSREDSNSFQQQQQQLQGGYGPTPPSSRKSDELPFSSYHHHQRTQHWDTRRSLVFGEGERRFDTDSRRRSRDFEHENRKRIFDEGGPDGAFRGGEQYHRDSHSERASSVPILHDEKYGHHNSSAMSPPSAFDHARYRNEIRSSPASSYGNTRPRSPPPPNSAPSLLQSSRFSQPPPSTPVQPSTSTTTTVISPNLNAAHQNSHPTPPPTSTSPTDMSLLQRVQRKYEDESRNYTTQIEALQSSRQQLQGDYDALRQENENYRYDLRAKERRIAELVESLRSRDEEAESLRAVQRKIVELALLGGGVAATGARADRERDRELR